MIKLIRVSITRCLAVAGQLSVAERSPVLSLLSPKHLGATQQGVGTRERSVGQSSLSLHLLDTRHTTPWGPRVDSAVPPTAVSPAWLSSLLPFCWLTVRPPYRNVLPVKAGTTVFPGSRTWRHESGNSERSVEQMIKLGVAQINTKEWRWGEERSCVEQLFFGDRFHTLSYLPPRLLGGRAPLLPLMLRMWGAEVLATQIYLTLLAYASQFL